MALTVWETYVEDRVVEAASERLNGIADSSLADFVRWRLAEQIKRLIARAPTRRRSYLRITPAWTYLCSGAGTTWTRARRRSDSMRTRN